MKKRILALIIALASLLPVAAQEYNHTIGLTVGSLNGLSYKYWATENFAFQLDLGFQIIETRTSGFLVKGPYIDPINVKWVKAIQYYGGRINPNLLWQKDLSDHWNIFLGGGFSADLISGGQVKNPELVIPADWENDKYACKFGINAILGIEYCFDGPLNVSLDFRPGYTVAYDYIASGYKYYVGAFDWNLCLGLRYRIGD